MSRKTAAPKKPARRYPVKRRVPDDPADRMRPAFNIPSPEQMAARLELVRNLLLGSCPRGLLHQAIVARVTPERSDSPGAAAAKKILAGRIGWPFPERQTIHAYETVRKQIAEAFEADQPTARALQAARLERDLLQIATDIEHTQPAKRGPLHHAKARANELLIKVQGTAAPTEIRVDPTLGARQTLIAVIMGMGPEEQARLVAEERARLAAEGEAGDAFPLIDERKEEPG
jgi:hypothetical protein